MALIYYDPIFLRHDSGDHPESSSRIIPAARRLNQLAMHMGLARPQWSPLELDAVQLVHDPGYVESLRLFCQRGGGQLDPDTLEVHLIGQQGAQPSQPSP